MSVLTTRRGWPRDSGRGASPRPAKVRVRPAPEFLSLDWRGEGRSEQAPGTACCPFPSPSPNLLWHVFPFRSCAGALRRGNKSNFPPSHCHLLGFHTLGVSGGREPLPFSQCLQGAPSAPPGTGILFAAQCGGARELEGVGARSSWKGNRVGRGRCWQPGGSLMDYSAGREVSP